MFIYKFFENSLHMSIILANIACHLCMHRLYIVGFVDVNMLKANDMYNFLAINILIIYSPTAY